MEPSRYLSTAVVAQVLGVSVTTVKRWVDEGVLPAQRTAGGHRKIQLGDVLRLAREQNWPQPDLGRLGGPTRRGGPPDVGRLGDQFFEALRRGDVGSARGLVQSASAAGLGIDRLADEVVAPVMARLGHGWEEGRLDVYHEHRGTTVCLEALLALKNRLRTEDGDERPVAVGGGPEHDFYLLANTLIQALLLEQGWDVIHLGPNTPLTSFGKAVGEFRPRLVWLSCSHLADPEAFLREYRPFYEEAVRAGAAVAVGGRALTEPVRSRMPYTTFGDGLRQLAAFARTLHPRPVPPRRGRRGR